MSREGWAHVHGTYAEAWQLRVESGDTSEALLIETFRRATPPAGVSDEGLPGKVILDFWDQGVEPNRLKTALHMGLARAIWRATVVPGKEMYDNFRGNPSR